MRPHPGAKGLRELARLGRVRRRTAGGDAWSGTSGTGAGGGYYGAEYAFAHRQNVTYTGLAPYTEWSEVGVAEPVYVFQIVLGMPRGGGYWYAQHGRSNSRSTASG